MADGDKVHPRDSPPENVDGSVPKPAPPFPGTYVIQIPKDQIYRVPPPDNARRYEKLSRRKPHSSTCRRCCCCFLSIFLIFLLALAVAAAVIYFVFKPESPDYTVEKIAISGFNLTSSSSLLSPEFDVTVRAQNPNDKIGIYYEKGSSVRVFYQEVNLCNGALPVFYQPTNNVTMFKTTLTGSGIELTSSVHKALLDAEKKATVPFKLKLRAPVKIKIGSVKTWKITVKVTCDVTVDKLTAASKIVSKDCDYGVDLW